ncbi:Hypothetical protein KVN_LOCUS301 [uncultured virus]|nr:Hypothetical protein KVN_LOCUS301 [uncultured virus]
MQNIFVRNQRKIDYAIKKNYFPIPYVIKYYTIDNFKLKDGFSYDVVARKDLIKRFIIKPNGEIAEPEFITRDDYIASLSYDYCKIFLRTIKREYVEHYDDYKSCLLYDSAKVFKRTTIDLKHPKYGKITIHQPNDLITDNTLSNQFVQILCNNFNSVNKIKE